MREATRGRRATQQKLAAIAAKYPNRGNYVIMPPIPWDPYQSDFWYSEVLNEIQGLLMAGDREAAERIARRDRLNELADLIYSGEIDAVLADRMQSPTGDLLGLARGGTMPSLAGLRCRAAEPAGFLADAIISARTARAATWPRVCSTAFASRFSSRSSLSSSGR